MAEREAVLPALPLRAHRQNLWLAALGRMLREKPLGTLGGLIVLVMLLAAVFADVVAPYDFAEPVPFPGARLLPPGANFLLGTDNLSRDLFSRIIYGARVSLYVGLGSVALGLFLATAIGVLSAYFGGKVDLVTQRLVDAWMSFPSLVITLGIMAVLGLGLRNIIIVIGLTFIKDSRVIRGAALSLKQNQYVEAARAIGGSDLRIMLRHLLPNLYPVMIVIASYNFGTAILVEATLSFLGYGIPPPTPSWGAMLGGTSQTYMLLAPWLAIWPGLALSLAVFGFNMFGDGLRDVLDPRLQGAGKGRFR